MSDPDRVELHWPGKAEQAAQPADLRQTDLIGQQPGTGRNADRSIDLDGQERGQGRDAAQAAGPAARQPDNRLILADNLSAMAALMPEFKGQLDLIYADPPFLTGKAFRARAGRGEDSRRPEEWKTTAGFADRWDGLADYLNMLYPRLQLMHALLSDHGTLYLHLDWHAAGYGRVLLDEIFGGDRLLNEIAWVYHGPSPIRSAFKRKHDTIYAYTKTADYTFNADAVRVPYDPSTVKTFESSAKAGFGKQPDLARGKVPEDWWYFPVVARLHSERTGYPTQKPEALLERIVLASSNPGELVADFFCGSGTTPVVAERHGRRWLACDSSPLAVNTTRRRLLLAPEEPTFSAWTDAEFNAPPAVTPKLELSAQAESAEARLVGVEGADDDSLTMLELDWEFDGQLFRSRSQAVRGWQDESLQTRLRHVYSETGEYTVAARVLTASGAVGYASDRLRIG